MLPDERIQELAWLITAQGGEGAAERAAEILKQALAESDANASVLK